jgi:hypothetical protein
VGGEVKEARGKGTEEYHLRRFIECFPEFPDGKLTLSEHPDFLLETSDALIGIEHTRYINSDLGAKESVENVALRLASQTTKVRATHLSKYVCCGISMRSQQSARCISS